MQDAATVGEKGRNVLLVAAMEAAVIGAVYFVAAKLSLHAALVGTSVTPVWPPSGIALVGLLVFGRRVSPGIYLGAFLVNATLSPPVWTAPLIALGNTLAPLAAYEALRAAHFDLRLERLRDAISLVFLGALGAMAISASIGTTTLWMAETLKGHSYAATWSVWWTGDVMGVLVFTPFLLLLLRARPQPLRAARLVEVLLLFGGSGVVAVAVFRSHLELLFLVFPFLIWAAWRFQQAGAAPVTLIVTVVAVWAAVNGEGIFAHRTIFDRMVVLQTFNGCIALTAFFLGATTAERNRAQSDEIAHRAREAELNRKRALELNDEVVQGLSVAKYALESGETRTGKRAIDHTLEAARQIVRDLLGASGDGKPIGPGDLVREHAALLGKDARGRSPYD
ncbi:MAG TPA: MASE1 domain-containing protein [Actinomycetota bacterium]|nr:MASE1 domain-containing protein [Actinomycetota bacterium]